MFFLIQDIFQKHQDLIIYILNSNTLQTYINNEEVKAIEGGYSFRSSSFSANINTYFTIWKNKPANISAAIGGN